MPVISAHRITRRMQNWQARTNRNANRNNLERARQEYSRSARNLSPTNRLNQNRLKTLFRARKTLQRPNTNNMVAKKFVENNKNNVI